MTEEKKEAKPTKGVSRREFIAGTVGGVVVGAVVGAAAGSLGFPKTVTQTTTTTSTTTSVTTAQPWLPAKWDYTADVVVCGYGSAGMPAAIEAYDAGVTNIICIEQASWLGGEGHRCGGKILSANTIVQKALGITDNQDDLYNYLVAVGQGQVDPSLLRSFANNDNVDWVIQHLGGQPVSQWAFSPDSTGKPITPVPDNTPDASIPMSGAYGLDYSDTPVYFQKYGFKPVMRCHWFNGDPVDGPAFKAAHAGWTGQTGPNGGTGVFKTMNDYISAKKSIQVMASTSLVGLVTRPEREVLGVKAVDANKNTVYIKANKGVVIGTGGWSANQSLVQTYLLVPQSQFKVHTNPASMATETEEDGTGVAAALAIGAATSLMGAGGGVPTGTTGGIGETLGSGGLKINDQAQVIDIYGNPIPRLYAGGRTAGGTVYSQYPCCGTDFSLAIWFGRVAGKNVAALTPWT